MADGSAEQRHGDRERRGCSGDHRKDRKQIQELAPETVHPVPQQGPAGLAEPAGPSSPDVQHKAECRGQHQIEAPGDGPPVEQREGRRPVLHASQRAEVGLLRVERPLAQAVEHDIRRHGGCKHHGAPAEPGNRLFRIAQADLSQGRRRQIDGDHEARQAHQADPGREPGVQEVADQCDCVCGTLRPDEECGADAANHQKRNHDQRYIRSGIGKVCLLFLHFYPSFIA